MKVKPTQDGFEASNMGTKQVTGIMRQLEENGIDYLPTPDGGLAVSYDDMYKELPKVDVGRMWHGASQKGRR